ncbi:MAG: 16S rRNA (cytidine(1402)-2'-O)-methyltransferase, partial [Kordiimonas sp.]
MAEIRTPKKLPAGLYIVATPIGNLGDITRRAKETLAAADLIACEDTRITGKLLNAYLLKKPMLPYHEHNAAAQRPKLLGKVADGQVVVLVSDAGTPLISDPGYKLVDEAHEQGLLVTSLPGPSAVPTALSVAGLPTNRFLFMGFAPTKAKARHDWFSAENNTDATLVYYESAKRLA